MKPVVIHKEEDEDKVEIRAECRAEDGKKHIEKVQVKTHDVDTLNYSERKLCDKGVQRLDRAPPCRWAANEARSQEGTWRKVLVGRP